MAAAAGAGATATVLVGAEPLGLSVLASHGCGNGRGDRHPANAVGWPASCRRRGLRLGLSVRPAGVGVARGACGTRLPCRRLGSGHPFLLGNLSRSNASCAPGRLAGPNPAKSGRPGHIQISPLRQLRPKWTDGAGIAAPQLSTSSGRRVGGILKRRVGTTVEGLPEPPAIRREALGNGHSSIPTA